MHSCVAIHFSYSKWQAAIKRLVQPANSIFNMELCFYSSIFTRLVELEQWFAGDRHIRRSISSCAKADQQTIVSFRKP